MPAPASAPLTPGLRLLAAGTRSTRMPDDPIAVLEDVARDDGIWPSLSGGERATIEVALSLEYGRPVNLKMAFTVMDHEHASMCVDAISEAAGLG